MTEQEMKTKLKKVLSDGLYNRSTQRTLEKMGFEIVLTKRHFKIYYKGNKTRFVTISETLSDKGRGVLNIVSDLIHLVRFVDGTTEEK